LPKHLKLCTPDEFRRVYAQGKRYDGSLMTAFVYPNGLDHHRLGITASRKAVGNAVQRNRSKRLLRETFRHSGPAMEGTTLKYDWVINARRALLAVKVEAPLEEFQRILARVRSDERDHRLQASNLSR
jgi:ribonuclease P protein component